MQVVKFINKVYTEINYEEIKPYNLHALLAEIGGIDAIMQQTW